MSAPIRIQVCADWEELGRPTPMGWLVVTPARGKQVFSFEYDPDWLREHLGVPLDPALHLYEGPQYPSAGRPNFGVFLDSSPDRWGRVLMRRREAQLARREQRQERRLLESDYLLGVHDGHRVGALRFRTDGPFLDDNHELAAPPWTSLRELQHASWMLEQRGAEEDPDYARWLRMLVSPGGSLGGARPKASVVDEAGGPWIAKFPSRGDDEDVGAWEAVTNELARRAGVDVPEARCQRFSSEHHTYLCRRFDRTRGGARRHFASALTLLERSDGESAAEGASYLELVELLLTSGADTSRDLEQLWRRIAFFACVSNTDDHLRNHGFLMKVEGWSLAPAYDVNPDPHGEGLKLNISESDNAQDLDLLREVAPYFRVRPARHSAILAEVLEAVSAWRSVARAHGLGSAEQDRMSRAFRLVTSGR